jgi:hypothetical protein
MISDVIVLHRSHSIGDSISRSKDEAARSIRGFVKRPSLRNAQTGERVYVELFVKSPSIVDPFFSRAKRETGPTGER